MLRDAIAQEIATGTIQPGEHLDEVAMARRFGVSRTPIREALMQLGTMGLVEMRPHRGAFVKRIGIAELVEEGRRLWQERAHLGDLTAIRARSRVTEADALCDPDGLGAFRVLEWVVD